MNALYECIRREARRERWNTSEADLSRTTTAYAYFKTLTISHKGVLISRYKRPFLSKIWTNAPESFNKFQRSKVSKEARIASYASHLGSFLQVIAFGVPTQMFFVRLECAAFGNLRLLDNVTYSALQSCKKYAAPITHPCSQMTNGDRKILL